MDKDFFCKLAQKHHKRMYEIAYQIVRNEADACDAVSEGILHAFEQRDKVKNGDKFSSWIYQIVRNEAINILRKRKRDTTLWKQLTERVPEADTQREELNAVVRELPEDCRKEIILFYYCGLSLKEIAELRQLPVGTVKSRIHRGKAKLRECFQIEKEESLEEDAMHPTGILRNSKNIYGTPEM